MKILKKLWDSYENLVGQLILRPISHIGHIGRISLIRRIGRIRRIYPSKLDLSLEVRRTKWEERSGKFYLSSEALSEGGTKEGRRKSRYG